MRVLIIGGAGNLGSYFARALLRRDHDVTLTYHQTSLPADLARHAHARAVQLDLDAGEIALEAFSGAEVVLFCAGKLFLPQPEAFLTRTNYEWARKAIDGAVRAKAKRFLLLSFPHVEEGTTPDNLARGTLDCTPTALHAQTRLRAERYLFEATRGTSLRPLVLRLGLVYGRGMKLMRTAERLLQLRLLAIWRETTWVHLIHIEDAAAAVIAAAEGQAEGIVNVCDEKPLTIQSLVDTYAKHLGVGRPMRLPKWMFFVAAVVAERVARILGTATPLNPDIMRMGMISTAADTRRFREELVHQLKYPSFEHGLQEPASTSGQPTTSSRSA